MGDAPDVIDLLIRDHQLLNDLLVRLDEEDRPAEMYQLFLRIADQLAAHEAAEDRVVFPAVRAAVPSEAHEVLDLLAEHEEVNDLLAEMLYLDPAGYGFLKRASALVVDLQDHFAQEEEILFPQIRSLFGPVELAELAARVRIASHGAPVFPGIGAANSRSALSAAAES